jgi:hypothetical protein
MQGMNYRICGSGLASSALYQTPFGLPVSNTPSKRLERAGWRIIKHGLIPILVRGPKNSVLLHPSD